MKKPAGVGRPAFSTTAIGMSDHPVHGRVLRDLQAGLVMRERD